MTDILGAYRTPGIIMGLIGRSVYGEMELVNIQPDITVSVHSHAARKLSGAGKTHTSGVLGNCVMSLLFFLPFFCLFYDSIHFT